MARVIETDRIVPALYTPVFLPTIFFGLRSIENLDEIYISVSLYIYMFICSYISRIHRFRRVSGRRSNDTSRLSRLNSLFNRNGEGGGIRRANQLLASNDIFLYVPERSSIEVGSRSQATNISRLCICDESNASQRTNHRLSGTGDRLRVVRSFVHSSLDSFVRSFVCSLERSRCDDSRELNYPLNFNFDWNPLDQNRQR